MVLLINNIEQQQVLHMKDCLEIVEDAIKEEGQGRAINRNKSILHMPTDDPGLWYNYVSIEGGIAKTKYVAIRIRSDMERTALNDVGSKVVQKYAVKMGSFCGLVLLYSSRNGELVAILNDGVLQHMRVGATYGLGAKYSSRKDSSVVGIIGSGGMANVHTEAYSLVRGIQKVKVYSSNKFHRERFAEHIAKRLGLEAEAVDDPSKAVKGSDIVSACTNALEPVIRADLIEDGMHLSEVTQFEFDEHSFNKIDRFVHYRTGIPTRQTAGSSVPETPSGTTSDQDFASKVDKGKVFLLKDVLLGKSSGRTNDKEVTFFFAEGTGVQFAAVAGRAYEEAKKHGLGKELPVEWFIQDIKT